MDCIICGINQEAETCNNCFAVLSNKHKEDFDGCLEQHREHNHKVLDLFAGCGGFSHGFLRAGYEIVGFVEFWEPAIQTFLKNHPNAKHIGMDITKISNDDIKHLEGKVDIIIGGPPCQGFSLCGKRDPNDKRNKLYKEFLRFVKVVNPEIVVMENVPNLLSMKDFDGELYISKIFRDFHDLNYSVSYKIMTASDYGVAQNRRRLIIVARKIKYFPYRLTNKKKTVMQALDGLPKGINGQIIFDTRPETKKKFSKLKQGERISPTFNFSRMRLYGDRPSKTVTTKPMYIHPNLDRFLTPRELARLQSFPDDFEFCGTKNQMVKQIGNAVPPLMAHALAEQLKEVLSNE